LQSAAYEGDVEIAEYLVKLGANINAPPSGNNGLTALGCAVERAHVKMVKYLLQLGANVNDQHTKIQGETILERSLDCSIEYEWPDRTEIFELLLNNGAQISGPPRRRCEHWNSALTHLVSGPVEQRLFQLVLCSGADVNQAGGGEGARTPIQAAAESGNLSIVKELFNRGAEINFPPAVSFGRTALQAACCNKRPDMDLVEFLIDKGAEINAPAGIKGGLTALQGAAIRGHLGIALKLLDAGADVNAEPADIDGRTALDGAAEHGRLDMVQLLLNHGASDDAGGFATAIKLAKMYDHYAVAEL
ncbi:ankyrin, partial [Glonium stellatum]